TGYESGRRQWQRVASYGAPAVNIRASSEVFVGSFPSGTTPATLRDGDPRTFDRELFDRLTGPERWAAVRRYVIRIGPGYRNHRRFPDDEAAASVARGSVLSGLWSLGLGLAVLWANLVPGLFVLVKYMGAT